MHMWVLQIDDDEDDLEIFNAAINLFDPAIRYSGKVSLEVALTLFTLHNSPIPDIIFLDINMPRHSGFDCYAVFRNDPRFTNTHFIFLSTNISESMIPADSAHMRKQYAMKDYVAMLSKHIKPPYKQQLE